MPIASAAISISRTAIQALPTSDLTKFLTAKASSTTMLNTNKYLLKGLSKAIPNIFIGGAVITPEVE